MFEADLKRKARKILGVSIEDNLVDIKKAYWKLAMKFHPDKNPHDKKASERFNLISEAYEILAESFRNDSCCVKNYEESIVDKPYTEWWMERFKDYV